MSLREALRHRSAFEQEIINATPNAEIVVSEREIEYYQQLAAWEFDRPDIRFVSRERQVGDIQRQIEDAERDVRRATGIASPSMVAAPFCPVIMESLATAPRDRIVMLVCPDKVPSHVAASWRFAKLDTGEIAWEGWCYADPMLHDLMPEGPRGATHWYDLPTLDTRLAIDRPGAAPLHREDARGCSSSGGRQARREFDYDWKVAPSKACSDLSNMQVKVLDDRGLRPSTVDRWRLRTTTASLPPITSRNQDADETLYSKIEDTAEVCPVIDRDLARNELWIVRRDGQFQKVRR